MGPDMGVTIQNGMVTLITNFHPFGPIQLNSRAAWPYGNAVTQRQGNINDLHGMSVPRSGNLPTSRGLSEVGGFLFAAYCDSDNRMSALSGLSAGLVG